MPQVVALSDRRPPADFGAVDYLTLPEGLNAGVLTPQSDLGVDAAVKIWRWFSSL